MRYFTTENGALYRYGDGHADYLDADGVWKPTPTVVDAVFGYDISLDEITSEGAAEIEARIVRRR